MAKRRRGSKGLSNGTNVKRIKPSLELSDLPMDILCSIISRLPIKEAARTSILSKHWQHVWCSRRKLEFSFQSIMPKSYNSIAFASGSARIDYDFIDRVEAVLKQHCGTGVEKFEVDYTPLHNNHACHIDRWLNFAIASKAKQLILDFTFLRPINDPYKFPFHLFCAANSSHLQYIKLGSVSLKPPLDFKGLPYVKTLQLKCVSITDEELQFLLPRCCVLESLGISQCNMLTSIQTTQPSNHLKHLQVTDCPSLKEIKLHFGLITLQYGGSLIPLAPPGTVTNLYIDSLDISSALVYFFTELPSTLPRLEMLTLRCEELERASLPDNLPKFTYLRHLRLELVFSSLYLTKRKTDVLDFACLLEAAPFMEKLEIHMWMYCDGVRYRKCHGELRSLPPHTHSHLKSVDVTGFYGQKDQLELLLHILRNSIVLEAMKIDPKPMVAATCIHLSSRDKFSFVDGYNVAKKYLRKADHRGVTNIIKVRLRDVKNVQAYQLVDPRWISALSENK